MKRFIIMYDYYDPEFGTTTLKESADTYDEALNKAEGLRKCDSYSNVEIVDQESYY